MANGDPLRIVHVLRAPMGGLFRHVSDLALAHQDRGHQVGVICDIAGSPGYNETMASELSERLALGLHRTHMRRSVGPGDVADALKVLRIIKELQPDVLHGHGAKGGVFARALGSLSRVERSRVARLYSPHGGSLHYAPESRSGRLYFRIERILERLTDQILFVADYEQQTYARKIGAPSCPWTVNYNGLRPAEFEPVKPSDGAADFLFLGELRLLKGPDLLLHALATLRASGRSAVHAVFVGDGPDAAAIRTLAEDLELQDNVAFHPPMPARDAFALARCFVMPSRAEALPYVVLEALAAGMPVIATRVGGIPEIFGKDNPSLVSPDSNELSRQMCVALDEPHTLKDWMPSQGDMRGRFSVDVMAANALHAYREALASRRHG
ncbi:glycosyltransferase family 4 protein [Oricola sp.]|uniref:glycosyltransferase family 4 protein n=1 Tax=Oricola sp. TaxID=1979950 RepID=UPI0025EB9642|nr:glycosyltransferase family 4 protein [Oricola sp.]MCI5077090.1 glycosyltransferase family 4 protein [Oricola sp.]